MYFVVLKLERLDAMYQFSLEWYLTLFAKGKDAFREYLWRSLAQSLLERHRILAAVLFGQQVKPQDNECWKCLLREGVLSERLENPTDYIPEDAW